MSVFKRCLSRRESNKGCEERHGQTLGVRFSEVSVLYRCTLIEMGGLFEKGGRLINLGKMMVSVLHKELECN